VYVPLPATPFPNSAKSCCRDLAPASNKEPWDCSLASPLGWDGEGNWKKKAKLVGWDKYSLTAAKVDKNNNNDTDSKEYTVHRDTQCNFPTT